MAYYPLPQPQVPDWGDTIKFWNQQQDRANQQKAYATAANALTQENPDYNSAVNALVRIGQPGQAALIKNTWQTPAETSEENQEAGQRFLKNPQEGINYSIGQGNFDTAGTLKKLQNDQLAKAAKDTQAMSNFVANIGRPDVSIPLDQQLSQAFDAADSMGHNTAKYRQIAAQRGPQAALDAIRGEVGTQAEALNAAQNQRKPIIAGIGELAADNKISDEDWTKMAGAYAAAHNNPDWLKPYLTSEGRRLALAESGKTIETQGTAKGGRRLAIDFGTQRVVNQFITQHPEYKGREAEIEGLAQSAYGNKTDLTLDANGKPALNLNPGTMAYKNSPEGVAANTRGREATKANVNLEQQLNRLDAVNDQIGKVVDLVSNPANRADAESAVGYLTNKSGQEYWRTGKGDNVPKMIFNLRAATHMLQDELAQYMQTKGGASDLRAKNAFAAIGDLPNSPNVETLVDRLHFISDMTSSIRKIRRINPLGEGSIEPPGQAKSSAPAAPKPPMEGARQGNDGNWYVPDQSRPGKYLRVD